MGYISKPQQINTNVRVQKNNEIPKVPTVLETLLLAKKDDDYNPKTALRMNLQESKKVKSDFIDLNDEDDDVIFVTDSRTSPPEVITIVDNDKDDGGINLMSVCRQLIVLEEYLKENNVEIRSLFNEALTLERANLNSSKSLLNNSNLKFLGSLMEKMKDVVVSGLIPDNRTSFAKKLIHDVIYLVENTEEVVGTIENEVIEMETEFMNAEEILEKVDDDVIEIVEQVTEIDVIEMELEVPKELDQKVSIREPEILPKLEQELLIKKPETPTKLKVLEATIVKEPEQDVPSSNIEKEPEQSTKKTPQDIPSIEKPSTSDIKPPVDISKYDNKRMKIAVDIGKALLASGKKVVTPEELDALVNVYLAVTADMSDSESDDE